MQVQIISLTGSLFFLVLILFAVRKGKLQEAYALLWLFIGILMVILSVFSGILTFLADLAGIQTPAFALLLFLIAGMLLLIFQCTIIISSFREKILKLTEEIVLLKEEMKQIQGNRSGHEDGSK